MRNLTPLTNLERQNALDQLLRWTRRGVLAVSLVAGAVVSGLGGGSAFAYFTNSGSGSGIATTDTAREITVTKQDVSGLFPGRNVDLVITVKNPYPTSALTILGITAGNGSVSVSGGSGCTVANSGVSLNTSAAPSTSSVAGGQTTAITFSGAVKMDSTTNFSGCQGATFTVPVAVNVKVA